MADMTVATTILGQLGGQRFIAMTGARNIVGDVKLLSFKLPTRGKNPNVVVITLNAQDTYDIEFGRLRKFSYTILDQVKSVYADSLRAVFEAKTGLRTSL